MKNQALDTRPWLDGGHHQNSRYIRLRVLIKGHQSHDTQARLPLWHDGPHSPCPLESSSAPPSTFGTHLWPIQQA